MNRSDITNAKKKIQKSFLEKEYLKTYNLSLDLLNYAKNNVNKVTSNDFFYCYIYISNCLIKSNRMDLAITTANKSLTYSTQDYEFLMSYNLLAMCHGEMGEIDAAVRVYNESIERCDKWLAGFDIHFTEEINKINMNKADAINNKGDLLKDINLIQEAINIYYSILNGGACDTSSIQDKIKRSYVSIEKYTRNFIHTSVSTS